MEPLLLADLRAACARAGYTEEALRGRLDRWPLPGAEGVQRLLLGGDDPVAVLGRLFLLGLPVNLSEAEPLLRPAPIDELFASGFLLGEGEKIWARYKLEPHGGLLLVSDPGTGAHPRRNVVTGVNPAAVATANLLPRRQVRSLLDLGTGSGIQALLGAAHSERVVAVDVNPRALAFAKANARLNRVTNVSWRQGSWLEPVRGERFELVVANPPFVLSPELTYLYRDSGAPPASLARELVTTIPPQLEEDGIAQVMLNWSHPATGDWAEPVRTWVAKSGCDALILRLAADDPVTYSARWNLPLLLQGAEAFEEALDRWHAYHRAHGVEAIASGALVLRRRSAVRNWVQALDVGTGPSGAAGEHVLRLFAAYDRLAGLRHDSELLDDIFELAPGHRIDQTLTRRHGRYRSHPAAVRVSPGLAVAAEIDPDALPILFECNGRRSLRELVGQNDRNAAVVSTAARKLLEAGLVVPIPNP